MYGRSRMTMDPRHPYSPGTEDVGVSPTRQTLLDSTKGTGTGTGDLSAALKPNFELGLKMGSAFPLSLKLRVWPEV